MTDSVTKLLMLSNRVFDSARAARSQVIAVILSNICQRSADNELYYHLWIAFESARDVPWDGDYRDQIATHKHNVSPVGIADPTQTEFVTGDKPMRLTEW